MALDQRADNQQLYDRMYEAGRFDKGCSRKSCPKGQCGSFAYDAYMRGYGAPLVMDINPDDFPGFTDEQIIAGLTKPAC